MSNPTITADAAYQLGQTHADVNTFLTQLATLGYAVTPATTLSETHMRAIMTFQASRGLQVTGVLDTDTWNSAYNDSTPAPSFGYQGTAPNSDSIVLHASAGRPFQESGGPDPPQVVFLGHAHVTRNGVTINVPDLKCQICAYRDGTFLGSALSVYSGETHYANADDWETKAIGTHNYQGYVYGWSAALGLKASNWSAIWEGTR